MNVYCTAAGSLKWLLTERGRRQRFFDCPSSVADGVFIMRSDVSMPLLFV